MRFTSEVKALHPPVTSSWAGRIRFPGACFPAGRERQTAAKKANLIGAVRLDRHLYPFPGELQHEPALHAARIHSPFQDTRRILTQFDVRDQAYAKPTDIAREIQLYSGADYMLNND